MSVAAIPADRRLAVEALLDDYVQALDGDRLEDWPELFLEDGLYKVVSRENVALGLPAPLVYYYSRGMMRDRVTAIRDALTFEPLYIRHLVSGPRISGGDGAWNARSNFAIFQTSEEGRTRRYAVGEYCDRIVDTRQGLRFAERIVTLDSFAVYNLIAVPL
ncbi:MAG TPA: aromatic-ring-hydroxylating dioxygenase subunit beta [Sphingopyxis sp.]|nr:aromatic-ring-hydroxylating dioxygenase subunit beta [Sphingopyxis sp.]HMP44532.1 aromatic-ring-hydroxylating dioxygenase subunit beta [Sphingopyxis sp.]